MHRCRQEIGGATAATPTGLRLGGDGGDECGGGRSVATIGQVAWKLRANCCGRVVSVYLTTTVRANTYSSHLWEKKTDRNVKNDSETGRNCAETSIFTVVATE